MVVNMDTNEERDTLITFIKLLGLLIIVLFILACKFVYDLNSTRLLLLNSQAEVVQITDKYDIAIDNLNSINDYVSELEGKLDKLEKLDKVYKEISRIYNQ